MALAIWVKRMSRSKKKFPIGSVCCVRTGEMKKWKKKQNRKIRRNKHELFSGAHYKKMTEIWSSPSDGKTWYSHPFYGLPHWKALRK